MSEHGERVTLVLTDNFSGPMARAKQAAVEMNRLMALRAATWEPHDWSEFE